MEISKDKLPAGWSYALKPTSLEEALRHAGVATQVRLTQWHKSQWKDGAIFQAHFYPPGASFRNEAEEVWVISHSIASAERPEARAFIESVVLPEFVSWLKHIESLPPDSTIRREKQSFARIWPPADAINGR